jgi:hypothetical protein
MDWIDLAQDRGRWRAFVNTVTYYVQLKNLSSIHMAEASEPGMSFKLFRTFNILS